MLLDNSPHGMVCEFARNKAEGPEYNIPSRYHGKANLFLKKDLIDAAVDCFGGELPKILTGLFPNINNASTIQTILSVLSIPTFYASYMFLICYWCCLVVRVALYYIKNGIVQAVVKVATDLEVLNINGDEYDDYGKHKIIQRESVTWQPLY